MNEPLLNKIFDKLDSMDNRLSNLEGQASETNDIVKSLMHRTETLSAQVSGLKLTTASTEAIERIETKIDILSTAFWPKTARFNC